MEEEKKEELPVKGKPFAIVAFALSVAALVLFFSALTMALLVSALKMAPVDFDEIFDEFYFAALGLCKIIMYVLTLITATVAGVFAGISWGNVHENNKNGVTSRFVFTFTLLATVFSAVSFLVSAILIFL